ncbi:nuclease-related domain-containing protein [Neobacillus sp. DY30]|uniref:nuclease-related domain-containing protein n=1 Tax=Neobacillus sp. DY30 TaxID=3047871 RepID=UPI0024C085E6|nr:nuclease-related domain-containing protein [Neobacillus sp. DY30]WHY01689.1 nuclease-related domain-containing protein [Neobacillus sp. DY30]
MFDKNLSKPIPLLQAEALEGRLRIDHEKMTEIKNNIKILKSGYNGEKELNYQLGQIPLHKSHIFHDLRLPLGESFFQIDALLASPTILINLDGKNHSGKITIEKTQMIQETTDTREIYENPVSQTNRHKILLRNWMEEYKLPPIFMDNLVVFTRVSSEIIIAPGYKEAENKVCKSHDLLKRIEELERYNKKVWMNEQDILNFSDLLLKKHTPKRTDILSSFKIPKSDIITGVQCPACLFAPMTYNRHKWICPTCKIISTDAHIRAIDDYCLIYKPWFTSSEIRNFLHLPSPRTVTYFLSFLNFTRVGNTSDSVYHQPTFFP